LNVGEVGRFDDASLIETERFPDGMFVLVVDVQTDDFVLSSTVEREADEVVDRVVADADGRRGIGLPNVLDGGRTIRALILIYFNMGLTEEGLFPT
jgi:hypothetical protein